LAFLDEEEGAAPPEVPERPRRPEDGPKRRRQQYLIRRLIGVGVGIAFLILVVLAFRGCLEAREERGIKNYVTDVGTIMQESEQRGKEFFEVLEGGTGSSDLDYERQIQLVRGASQSLLDRAEGLDAPDQMSDANNAIQLSLELRAGALDKIADNVGEGLADEERGDAIDTISNQMASLYSSDVLYIQVAKPEIEQVLEAEGISAPELPAGNFMPSDDPASSQNLEWLDSTQILDALSVATGTELDSGVHGMSVLSVSMGDIRLDPDASNEVGSEREIAVEVQNGGTVEESGVVVVVTLEDEEVRETLPPIAAGGTGVAKLALPPAATTGTEATLEVLVEPVPEEAITDDNEYSYTVVFG
jgi:hypothetical protein